MISQPSGQSPHLAHYSPESSTCGCVSENSVYALKSVAEPESDSVRMATLRKKGGMKIGALKTQWEKASACPTRWKKNTGEDEGYRWSQGGRG